MSSYKGIIVNLKKKKCNPSTHHKDNLEDITLNDGRTDVTRVLTGHICLQKQKVDRRGPGAGGGAKGYEVSVIQDTSVQDLCPS